ncbi:MAG: hypothetical protein JOZ72_18900 [Alphaproteobacteria bacterium]|nr:hypothetical protein [Alphaproteobacteria bacterium]
MSPTPNQATSSTLPARALELLRQHSGDGGGIEALEGIVHDVTGKAGRKRAHHLAHPLRRAQCEIGEARHGAEPVAHAREAAVGHLAQIVVEIVDADELARRGQPVRHDIGAGVVALAEQIDVLVDRRGAAEIVDHLDGELGAELFQVLGDALIADAHARLLQVVLRGHDDAELHQRRSRITADAANTCCQRCAGR